MSIDSRVVTTAMEGGGFYNRNSDFQAAGIELALPYLQEAARAIPLGRGEPIVIADYGCSQGRNSMRPVTVAIETLRERAPACPVEVIHTDQPSNDFASLFVALRDDPDSYLAGQSGIFASAVGRSYFEPLLPPGRVHLGWNSWTFHWLSRNPVDVPDHSLAILSDSADAREAVRLQLREDWRRFLRIRSSEMRDGAMLVALFVGATESHHGWEWVFGELWQALAEMDREGLLPPQSLLRMTVPCAGRTIEEIKAPFATGTFASLSLVHGSVVQGPDPFWDRYRESGDAQQLGRSWAGMMRAVASPTITAALGRDHHSDAFLDDLFARYGARVSAAPQRNRHFLGIVVVRKTGVE
jgi:SAM dependent carboxyl methyltransferase